MKTWVHTDKAFMESVIRQSPICFVGLADTDGTPYVLPMNFGYHEGVIYLGCDLSAFRPARTEYLYSGAQSEGVRGVQYR